MIRVIIPLVVFTLIIHLKFWTQSTYNNVEVTDRYMQAQVVGTNQGLSQGYVKDIFEDHFGRLWFCTKDGFNCYDGTQVRTFRQNSSALLLKPAVIDEIHFCTGNRLIWMSDANRGLVCFDMAKNCFVYPGVDGLSNSNTGQWQVDFICEDARGNVLLNLSDGRGFQLGNWRVENDNVHWTSTPLEEAHPSLIGLKARFVYPWKEETISERNLVTYSRRLNSGDFYLLMNDSIWVYQNGESGLLPLKLNLANKDELLGLYTNYAQDICFAYSHSTLYRCTSNFQLEPVLNLPNNIRISSCPLVDRRDRVWITNGDDILRQTPGSKSIDFIHLNSSAQSTLAIQKPRPWLCDRNGNIWILTSGYGAVMVSSISDAIELDCTSRPLNWFAESTVHFTDDYGNLVYDRKWHNKFWEVWDSGLLNGHHPGTMWKTMLAGDTGELIFPSGDPSLSERSVQFEPTVRLISVNTRDRTIDDLLYLNSLDEHRVGDPVFRDRKGFVWIGEHSFDEEVGVTRLDISTGEYRRFIFPFENTYSEYRAIHCWLTNEDGTVWFGTNKGLFLLDPESEVWLHYTTIPGDETSLAHDVVFSLCYDPVLGEDVIWIGTNGGGICRMDVSSGKFTCVNSSSGLPNDVIYGIHSDDWGSLWMSTNKGIVRLRPNTLDILDLDMDDGLPGNEFNRYAHGRSPEGAISFGGTLGMVLIHPEEFEDFSSEAEMIFTGFKVDNKIIVNGDESGLLSMSMPFTNSVSIPPGVRMIEFQFTLTDLTSVPSIRYKYKLENYSDEWVDLGSRSEVVFTNLSPGDYTLRVKGRDFRGHWIDKEAILNIVVLPPWYETWWFRACVLALLMAFVYSVYRYRLNQLLKVEKMRNQIAQDLHDDIGSTLSSISLYSQVMQNTSTELTAKSLSILSKISENVTSMMESMNDIVWTIKADNDDLEHVINRMRAYAVNITELKGIQLDFDMDESLNHIKLDMLKRKNIYLIFKEAVNNAVKYSGCTRMFAKLEVDQNLMYLSISDNGTGFILDEVIGSRERFGGNGLQGMDRRAREIHATLFVDSGESGTNIRLVVPVR